MRQNSNRRIDTISDIKMDELKWEINRLVRIEKEKINLTYQMPHLYFTKLFALFCFGIFFGRIIGAIISG